MAYTPSEWSCGQTVTAEKLNNIERGVDEVNSEYIPTTWQRGDVITAEKMNKIEQGIANAGGGGDLKNKTLTMTVINNSSEDAGNIFVCLDNNGMIENKSVFLPASNETGEYASLIVPSLEMGEYYASQPFNVPPSATATASNENNCIFSNGMFGSIINITDYTQDASITITLSDS